MNNLKILCYHGVTKTLSKGIENYNNKHINYKIFKKQIKKIKKYYNPISMDEVIMHKSNLITEGGASNIFFANNDTVFTPSLSNNILPGITRELLINEIKNLGIKVVEVNFELKELETAHSIWLTSSTKGLAQVTDVINLETKVVEDHNLFKKCEQIFFKKFLSGS